LREDCGASDPLRSLRARVSEPKDRLSSASVTTRKEAERRCSAPCPRVRNTSEHTPLLAGACAGADQTLKASTASRHGGELIDANTGDNNSRGQFCHITRLFAIIHV